jgi:hypothetical protein
MGSDAGQAVRRRGSGDLTNRLSRYKGNATGWPKHMAERVAGIHPQRAGEALGRVLRFQAQLLDFNRDTIALHHHGATGNGEIIGQNLDFIVFSRIQLDDGAAAKPEHLMNRHVGGAKYDRNVEENLIETGHPNPVRSKSYDASRSSCYSE